MRKDEAVGNKKKMQVWLPKQLTETSPCPVPGRVCSTAARNCPPSASVCPAAACAVFGHDCLHKPVLQSKLPLDVSVLCYLWTYLFYSRLCCLDVYVNQEPMLPLEESVLN
jgi:hypothetical protein